jgi:hypothetical protein
LFPALRTILGPAEYRALGEQLEELEHQALGPNGFERALSEVASLEKALGIDDLATFTPT